MLVDPRSNMRAILPKSCTLPFYALPKTGKLFYVVVPRRLHCKFSNFALILTFLFPEVLTAFSVHFQHGLLTTGKPAESGFSET